jgi:hypothetical protein
MLSGLAGWRFRRSRTGHALWEETQMNIVADKMEIRELLFKYGLMVDKYQWELEDDIFHKDATIDYTSVGKGGTIGPYKDMLVWLRSALLHSPVRYHFISNEIITVDGDNATSCCCFNAPMGLNIPGEPKLMMTNAGHYYDKIVRTPKGWRISERFCDMGLQIFHPL